MKKLNLINSKKLKLALLTSIVLSFISCKSLPDYGQTKVHPVDLLDNNSSLYVAIPKTVDPELLKYVLTSNIQGASDSDINQIYSRVNTVYAGIKNVKNNVVIQAAIDSNIPVSFIPNILTKKNGWNSEEYIPNTANSKYTIYSFNQLDVAFPSDKITCIGRDLPYMLEYYDFEHYLPLEESIGNDYNQINIDAYKWLKSAEKEIKFYTTETVEYLGLITGMGMDLNLKDIRGSVVPDSKNDKNYLVTLYLNFKNSTTFKFGKTIISFTDLSKNMAFDSENPNMIIIKNVAIPKEQIYNILIK